MCIRDSGCLARDCRILSNLNAVGDHGIFSNGHQVELINLLVISTGCVLAYSQLNIGPHMDVLRDDGLVYFCAGSDHAALHNDGIPDNSPFGNGNARANDGSDYLAVDFRSQMCIRDSFIFR